MWKVSKHKNVRTKVDGIKFMSKKEAARYGQLKLLLKSGMIESLELQPRFKIEHNGVKICTYVADFRYVENGKIVVEDVKGQILAMYRLKKKLVKAFYNIDIFET